MQEMRPILLEFSKLNQLRAPNYPPDMFGSKLTHHDREGNDEGKDSKTGGDAQDPLRIEDEYEAAFQPQYSTPKGPVNRSPTSHAPSTGGSSHQEYGSGKEKALMETRQVPHWDDEWDD